MWQNLLCTHEHIGLNADSSKLIFSEDLIYTLKTMAPKGILVPNSRRGWHLTLSPTTQGKLEVLFPKKQLFSILKKQNK